MVLRWMINQATGAGVKMNTNGLKTIKEYEDLMNEAPSLFEPIPSK